MMQPVFAIGIGITPSEININNGFKGAVFEKTLTIFNTGQQQTNFSLSAGGNISDWVSFQKFDNRSSNITSILIPKEDKVSLVVVFHIPFDAANGNYSGTLDMNSIPENNESEGSQSSMIVGASTSVKINVTGNQILQGEVTGIFIEDTEVNYPLKTHVMFKNTGNVEANPKIESVYLRKGEEVGHLVNDSTHIKPTGLIEEITTLWDTHGQSPENYTANITVSLNGSVIKSDNIPFTIFPVGTFSRQGNLTDILINGKPEVDKVSKIIAHFNNTGEIETSAKFTGEIYQGGSLVDTISSDVLTVEKYTQGELVAYYKPTSTGDYEIKGKVTYSGKETPEKEVPFNVPGGFPSLLIGVAAVVLIAAIAVILKQKKK